MARKRTEPQIADLSQEPVIPAEGTPESPEVPNPENVTASPATFADVQSGSSYDVVCPACGSKSCVVVNTVEPLMILKNVQCPNNSCLKMFDWNVTEQLGMIRVADQPGSEEKEVIEKAFAGLNESLETPIQPPIFAFGEIVHTRGGDAILIDYRKFIKYTYGLIILGNPALANSYIGQAGKGKLFQLLGITDRDLQNKIWDEFKMIFNNKA